MTDEHGKGEDILEAALKSLSEHFDAVLIVARQSPDGEHSSIPCVWDAHISEAMGLVEVAKERIRQNLLRDDE